LLVFTPIEFGGVNAANRLSGVAANGEKLLIVFPSPLPSPPPCGEGETEGGRGEEHHDRWAPLGLSGLPFPLDQAALPHPEKSLGFLAKLMYEV
jgi:hypothetical protein